MKARESLNEPLNLASSPALDYRLFKSTSKVRVEMVIAGDLMTLHNTGNFFPDLQSLTPPPPTPPQAHKCPQTLNKLSSATLSSGRWHPSQVQGKMGLVW
jgi:hypothetical protein